jgi:hypothetical protein
MVAPQSPRNANGPLTGPLAFLGAARTSGYGDLQPKSSSSRQVTVASWPNSPWPS